MSRRPLAAPVLAVALGLLGACAVPAPPPTAQVAPAPGPSERFESRTSVASPGGGAWQFDEGLSIRITGATRLASTLGAHARGDVRLTLVRIDFSYTNNGPAVNLSDGYQLPVRLFYGDARDEAMVDPGFVGTSDQLTVRVPTTVEPGQTVHGAGSFVVPVAATGTLSVLAVEPRRYTEHLFTDVELLFDQSNVKP